VPEKTVTPLFLKDVDLLFAADDFGAHVSSVTLTPSSSTATWKGLKPSAVFTNVTKATWVATLEGAQDWSEDGLSRYLFDHEGETIEVTFTPEGGGPSFKVSLVITPGAIGGAVDAYATQSVSLGVNGRPVLVPSA
jgi:hypothetical protein